HERVSDWSASSPKGHAYTHVFRKTALQYARRGEDANLRVARDARVSEEVMMTHYVDEKDPELREASNRTFARIVASLQVNVAHRYGYLDESKDNLERRLEAAFASKDWPSVAEFSAKLIGQRISATG